MLQELFQKQKESLDYFFHHLDLAKCQAIVEAILQCKGVLFLTGVGKSGYIAQKIAATMMSTGTKAFFLSPIDALHGDVGMVSGDDIVLFFSKSGETEELLHLLPALRNKGARCMALVSQEGSRLTNGSDFSLRLPCLQELCPFDLAPTISAEVQLLFGDALAVALMRAKQFSIEAYAENHPAGQIGKRATLKVRDLMLEREKAPLCFPELTLGAALACYSEKKCGCLLVVDREDHLKGIFTDGDLRRALQNRGGSVLNEKIHSLMITSPRSIHPDALAYEAMRIMESDQKHPVTVLPVLSNNRVVGLIRMHDILQAGV